VDDVSHYISAKCYPLPGKQGAGDHGAEALRPPPGVDLHRLENRRALLEGFDSLRRDLDTRGELEGMDTFQQRAFAMVTSDTVRRALDVGQEDPKVRQRYGPARDFRIARRLAQAGVGCVTLDCSAGSGWDTHGANFTTLQKNLLPLLDQGMTALVEDLHRLGLNNDVLVLAWGEFGRTPRINSAAGRDHWPNVMSCLMAGGGLKMGQVIGATTNHAEEAKEGRYSMQSVLATVYHALGFDLDTAFPDKAGRPLHILEDRKLVKELL
jgi:hypothetical protein